MNYTPFGIRADDYQLIIINFQAELFLRSSFILLCLIQMKILSTIQLKLVCNYLYRSEKLLDYHKIDKKL